MKKLLLASALLMAATAAHAELLPNTITGDWCFESGDEPGSNQQVFVRTEDCRVPDGGLTIYQDHAEAEASSIFIKIQKIAPNVYSILEHYDDAEPGVETWVTYEIVNGKLVITFSSEG